MPVDPRDEREAARIVAAALRQDASAHEARDFAAIGERCEDVQILVCALCGGIPEGLGASFTFWDEWADARNHEWMYYEDIARDDWPRLARHLADCAEAGVPISDPTLVRHFEELSRPGCLACLGRLLGLRREPG